MSKRFIIVSIALLIVIGILAYGGYWFGVSHTKSAPIQDTSQVSQGSADWRWGDDSGHKTDCDTEGRDLSNPAIKWAYEQRCPSLYLPARDNNSSQPTYYLQPQPPSYKNCTSYSYGLNDRFTSTSCY